MELLPTARRTAPAMPWLLFLCLAAAAATGGLLQAVVAQSNLGFISIDCGLPGETGYTDDNTTTLSYTTDAGFIDADAGSNKNISVQYITQSISRSWYTVRSFPGASGERNCYTLGSLESGLKYLIRGKFFYGNYDDGLSQLPIIFDLYVGVNFWTTVNVSKIDAAVYAEAIVVVPGDVVQVCLVNTGGGTPFISGLDLRPLKNTLYPLANGTQGLVLLYRFNFGPTDTNAVIRYPVDPHDRIWFPWVKAAIWAEISTNKRVENNVDELFEAPMAVMQTAITPQNVSSNIEFTLPLPKDRVPQQLGYISNMYFSELQQLPRNASRQFYININGELWYSEAYEPTYLDSGYVYSPGVDQYSQYDVSINATANSTLPPIINAIELFSVVSTSANIGTDSRDVSAITEIKGNYKVRKNWMGDPCFPKSLVWVGLTCSYAVSKPPIIRSVNLSFSGLNGDLSSSFANLKNIRYMNLSNNNLTGSIPDALSQLPSLILLDLSNNKLNGSIPSGLVKRIQDGTLDLRYGNNPDLCTNGNSCQLAKRKNNRVIIIVVTVVVIFMVIILGAVLLFFCLLRRKNQEGSTTGLKVKNEMTSSSILTNDDGTGDCSSLRLENRRFTYKELEMITSNFKKKLGQGGFGYVYHGVLEDGIQVAVKLRSQSSNQGAKEFLAEAQILTRIHHKNLVTMIGYCKDGEYMALVCEYMPEGNLQEHIAAVRDRNAGACLTWRQRLQIAHDSAQGLEYLHKGCNPPVIHRDVKATNILLNTKLEAKIADFGLSKAFSVNSTNAHVSTDTLVGTPGYVDPEYQATMQPSTKSDVYSFGVVLLELITGKPAIVYDSNTPITLIRWVQQRLGRGDIEGVVDTRMDTEGDYDVNSVWKAAEIALKCTEQASLQRPTMTDLVVQLHECLELQDNHRIGVYDKPYKGSSSSSSGAGDVRQSNTTSFQMEKEPTDTIHDGPSVR